LEVARELLTRGASPGLAAFDGSTALSVASAGGHAAIAQLLRAALDALVK
jgi:ankyrin repeat protein